MFSYQPPTIEVMKFKSLLIAALMALPAFQANAVTILVAEWAATDSADATELADVAAKILAYNSANNPDLPLLGTTTLLTTLANKATTGNIGPLIPNDGKVMEWTAPTGTYAFFYVMTKWGQGQANFDHALHYITAGDSLTYNPGGAGAPNGLSHAILWGGGNSPGVPDGGSVLAFLGLSLAFLEALRRKLLT